MKKRISFLLAVIMILAVMVPAIPVIADEPQNMWNPTADPASYKINTPADYTEFIKHVFVNSNSLEGVTVTLERDLDFNDGIELNDLTTGTNYGQSSGDWTGYFKGTFDGQNHTISGLYISSSGFLNGNIGFIPATTGAGTIQNLKLDRFYIEGTHVAEGAAPNWLQSGVGALIGLSKGGTIINCELSNGIVTAATTSVTATVGSLIGNMVYETGYVHLIKDVKVAPTVEVVSNNQTGSAFGGAIGYYYAKTTDTLDFDGSKINPKNADTMPAFGVAEISAPMGHTFMNSSLLAINSSCGGTAAESTSTGSPAYTDKLNAAVEGLKFYGSNAKTYDEIDQFTISSFAEYKTFYEAVYKNGKDFDGKTVSLAGDVTFNDITNIAEWGTTAPANVLPGGFSENYGFKGTFDGANHTITGLYAADAHCDSTNPSVGLFARLAGGVIKNLTVNGFYVKGETAATNVGVLVGSSIDNKVRIENCTLTSGTVVGDADDVAGALVGYYEMSNSDNHYLQFVNVTVEPSVSVTATTAGGILGKLKFQSQTGNAYPMFAFANSNVNPANSETELNPIGNVDTRRGGGFDWNIVDTDQNPSNAHNVTPSDSANNTPTFNNAIRALGGYGPAANPNNTFDLATYDTAASFTLTTDEDFVAFYNSVHGGGKNYEDKTVTLADNITLNTVSGSDWYTSAELKFTAESASYFNGVFDGNNKTITGLYVENGKSWFSGAGLFAATGGADVTIKNLTLDGYYILGSTAAQMSNTGSLIGYVNSTVTTIDNCTLRNGTVGVKADDTVPVVDENSSYGVGGVVGTWCSKSTANTALSITNTVVEDTVTVTGNTGTNTYYGVGGIIGFFQSGSADHHDFLYLNGSRFTPAGTDLKAVGRYVRGSEAIVDKNGDSNKTYTVFVAHDNRLAHTDGANPLGATYPCGKPAHGTSRANNDTILTDLNAAVAGVYGATYEAPKLTFAGTQIRTADGAVRFVGIIEGYENYDKAGFEVVVTGSTAGSKALETTKVYTSLVSGDGVIAAEGDEKYFTFVLTDVPANTEFTIRAFVSSTDNSGLVPVTSKLLTQAYTFTTPSAS